jgi:sulfur-carrier protein
MKVLYFAWLRERVGQAEEIVAPPAGVDTVGALMDWLAGRDEAHAFAFENRKVVRAAMDQVHVKPTAAIAGAREIAFFPPMTGG